MLRRRCLICKDGVAKAVFDLRDGVAKAALRGRCCKGVVLRKVVLQRRFAKMNCEAGVEEGGGGRRA